MKKKFKRNIKILAENDIYLTTSPVWDDKPESVELETYTDAGEDMIICLEEPSRKELLSYIDGFDVNDNVLLWWQSGIDAAHEAGVPFDNIKEHYVDYENYLDDLRRVANLLN